MLRSPLSWPWPLPALLVWSVVWVFFVVSRVAGMGLVAAWVLATGLGVLGAAWTGSALRRLMVALGFPLSWWLLSGGEGTRVMLGFPAWTWLLLLGLLIVLYPPGTWRDAPLYPTPPGAFDGLAARVPLPLAGHVLDAGCGLGDGLLALERAYPEVHLHGMERSWPLRWACAWRVRQAHVRQGDIWAHDWSAYDMVYLFQRPESMPRAWSKAQTDLCDGAWLASLEFAVPQIDPSQVWTCPDGRTLWLYRMSKPHKPQ